MRLKINKSQFEFLANNFIIVEDNVCHNEKNLIQESRLPEYLVSIIVQGQPAEIRISGYSRTSVLNIARKLFGKNATITGSVRKV